MYYSTVRVHVLHMVQWYSRMDNWTCTVQCTLQSTTVRMLSIGYYQTPISIYNMYIHVVCKYHIAKRKYNCIYIPYSCTCTVDTVWYTEAEASFKLLCVVDTVQDPTVAAVHFLHDILVYT